MILVSIDKRECAICDRGDWGHAFFKKPELKGVCYACLWKIPKHIPQEQHERYLMSLKRRKDESRL